MAFSATDVAFEGFRITRERPLLVLGVTVFQLVVGIALSLAITYVSGRDPAALVTELMPRSAQVSEAEAMRVLQELLPIYEVLIPALLVLGVVCCCAVYRAVLRPSDRALAFLMLGLSELRMLPVLLIYLVLTLLTPLALGVAVVLGSLGGPLAVVLVPVFAIAVMCGVVWICVRLSFAGPSVFAERRIDLMAGWRETRGQVSKLLGAYLLALALAAVVFLLGSLIIGAIATLITNGGVSVGGPFSPGMILFALLQALLWTLIFLIVIAPPAAAYRALRADESAQAF
jgi:hypothetical protein